MIVRGSLVLDDRIAPGHLVVEDHLITEVGLDDGDGDGPLICPGFVDLHVHGWGGHDAMGGPSELTGMASALLRQGVTSFLPTAVAAPLGALVEFAGHVHQVMASGNGDRARILGSNLEGPFLAPPRAGAQNPAHLRTPDEMPLADLEPLLDGVKVITIAPEVPGALALIQRLSERGIAVSLGHSDADLDSAGRGYRAGATGTTHLFNAMSGLDHHRPGLATAALLDDDVSVELIADGHHVHPALWPLVVAVKPPDRVILVSDGVAPAGTGDTTGRVGELEVEVVGGRCTLAGTDTLAGGVTGLDQAVRNLVAAGVPLPGAVATVTRNPLALIGVSDRGRLAPGQCADLVELDEDLWVRRVAVRGRWTDVA